MVLAGLHLIDDFEIYINNRTIRCITVLETHPQVTFDVFELLKYVVGET